MIKAMQKRLMIIAVLLLAICNKIAAADQVTISEFSIFTGQTKDVSISLTNDKAYAAFQFDLVLPDGVTIVEPTSPDTWNSHKGDRIPSTTDLSMQQLSDGSYRFVAMPGSTTIQNISGSEGVIINLTLSAAATAAVGNQTGYFRNIKLSTSDGVAANGNTITEQSFTFATRGDEPYAVLSDENTKLTFYYDKQKDTRDNSFELDDKGWLSYKDNITLAVFDNSFASYTGLTSTAGWFMSCSNLSSITDIANLKTDNVTDMRAMFYECKSLTSLDLSSFNTNNVTDMSNMFFYCQELTTLDLSSFNTSKVEAMNHMFQFCSKLTTIEGLTNWETSSVTNMDRMFSNCYKLTNLDLSSFNTANVTNMYELFCYCKTLQTLNISNFNTENVTNMWAMFAHCSSLTSLDLKHFNTSKAETMETMFNECSKLTSLDLSSFNTSLVTNMESMFQNCNLLTTIYVSGDKWSTANLTDGIGMFLGCTNLIGGCGTIYDAEHTNHTYAHIDNSTSPGYFTDVQYIDAVEEPYALLSNENKTLTFYYDKYKAARGGMSIESIYVEYDTSTGNYTVTGRGWESNASTITKVVFDASIANCTTITATTGWFFGCTNLSEIEGLTNLNTASVTDMSYMFAKCSSLTALDLSTFNTERVTNMDNMFAGCSSLTTLDISSFNTQNVTIMSWIFRGCSSLTTLNLTHFNLSNLIRMEGMFYDCKALISLGINSFITENVTNMSYLFYNCNSLTDIEFGESFSTEKVTNMSFMFAKCSKLTELDLSKFNTALVTNMQYMFVDCSLLKTIYVGSSWTTSALTTEGATDMFTNSLEIVGGLDTSYDSEHVDATYARIDGGPTSTTPGYLTDVQYKGAVIEPYATLSSDYSALSFYYDKHKEARGGMDLEGKAWQYHNTNIISAKFDDSFAEYTGLTSTAGWFSGCSNLASIENIENLKTDNVTDMGNMFEGCSNLSILDLSSLNTANVTNMQAMFKECSGLYQLTISSFQTSNVTNMNNMFESCSSLTSLDLSGFNTANVQYMTEMFYGCSGLTSLDISSFNTTKVTLMDGMFWDCSQLTTLDLSSFNTEKVEIMISMFESCTSLTTIYVSNLWTTSGIPEVSPTYGNAMFSNCNSLVGAMGTVYDVNKTDHAYAHIDGGPKNPGYLTDINPMEPYVVLTDNADEITTYEGTSQGKTLTFYYDSQKEGNNGMDISGSTWRNNKEAITKVVFDESFAYYTTLTSTANWFSGCSNLTSIENIENLKTDYVTDMYGMFYDCESLTSLDLSNFNTANVTNMNYMFSNCTALTSLDLSNFNTANVTNMGQLFSGCTNLTILNVSSFNTEKVTNMFYMFNSCYRITGLDVSNFKTDNVTDMDGMFWSCSSLTSLDVSNFKTDNVTDMGNMFQSCDNLKGLDLSNFNTDNVTDMEFMFNGCSSLTNLDVSNFNTGKVIAMKYMFGHCSSLTSLDLSSFKTDNVTDMSNMFNGCSILKTVYVGNEWSTTAVTNSNAMFIECTKLFGGTGTTYDSSHIDHTYAHIDGGTSNPGYFTDVQYKDAVNEPYAVISGEENNKVMTFYYDNMKGARSGFDVGPFTNTSRRWDYYGEQVTSVVFDDSFAECDTIRSTAYWFEGFKNLTSITGLSNLKTDNATSMVSMFQSCEKLTSLDLSTFNTSKVTNMQSMFKWCYELTTVNLGNFDASNVTNMGDMFYEDTKLETIIFPDNLNTAKVTDMSRMFYNCKKLTTLNLKGFDTGLVEDFAEMFRDCASLSAIDVSRFNTESATRTTCMFYGCSSVTKLDLGNFSTPLVTDMDGMFNQASSLKTIYVDPNKWVTVDESSMFTGCTSLVGGEGTTYNSSEVGSAYARIDDPDNDKPGYFTDVAELGKEPYAMLSEDASGNWTLTFCYDENRTLNNGMKVEPFSSAEDAEWYGMRENINKVAFDNSFVGYSNLTSTAYWFYGFKNLTSINGLDKLNTASVNTMQAMFYACEKIEKLYLWNLNTTNVTNMNAMFSSASGLTTIYVGDGWNTSNVRMSDDMFKDCTNLVGVDGTTYDADHTDVTYARIDGGADNPGYLTGLTCELKVTVVGNGQVKLGTTVIESNTEKTLVVETEDLLGLTITPADGHKLLSVVVDTIDCTREFDSDGDIAISSNRNRSFIFTFVNDTSEPYAVMSDENKTMTFYYDKEKDSRGGMSATNYWEWDNYRESITQVVFDESMANCTDLTSTAGWFRDCSNLTTLTGLANLKTENVTEMQQMFQGCSSLTNLDLSTFNTQNVITMFNMFGGCSSLTSIDLSSFNTENVEYLGNMFRECSSLSTLDLSSFTTPKVTNIAAMFYECTNLKTIYVSHSWYTELVTEGTIMFAGCQNLIGGNGTVFDADHTDHTYARIDGGTSDPGYFTDKYGVTLTAKDYTREYGAENPTFEYTVTGAEFSGKPSITCEATATSAVGTYPIVITYTQAEGDGASGSTKLNVTCVNGTLTITKAPLKVAARSYTIKRGAELPIFEVEYSGFKNNETDTVLTKKAVATCEAKSDTLPGTYQIVVSGAEAYNYEMEYVNGSLTITDDVVVTAKSYTREYGEDNPIFEYTAEGAILEGTPAITCEATATSPVGTYDITIAKGDITNSDVTYVKGTLTITKAKLKATAKSYTIKRGAEMPNFEVEYSGFKNNETDTVLTKKAVATCEAKSDTLPGTYQIVVSGAEAYNYEMEYVNGSLTITDDVVVTAKSYTREYGEDNPTFEYIAEGAILEGTPAITCEATATSPVGTYEIVISKGDITNSEVTYVKGTLTITKAPLTIKAKSYSVKQGKNLPTLELEYSGFKNNETDTVFTTKPTVSTRATSYSYPGTYEITVFGAEARNYNISYVNGTLTITEKTETFDGNVLTVNEGGNLDDAFENMGGREEAAKTIAAIIWNSNEPLTDDMLEGIDNPNLLVYVSNKRLAPKNVRNVVINGVAQYIQLTDDGTKNCNFYVPEEFVADSIVYTREFKQTTQKNVSRGWEGIVLPFTVQTFTHEAHGEIAPFGNTASNYHFWLHAITENGVVDATTIEANKPYIISMPNSKEYTAEFNQAGLVTFASADVKVPVTETRDVWLGDSIVIIPTFQRVEKYDMIYALNVLYDFDEYQEGSVFVSNYRDIRPFEIYTFHEHHHHEGAGGRIISLSSLFGGNGTTGIIPGIDVDQNGEVWYDMNGRRLQSKPVRKGVYINNGKKVVIK